MARKYYKRPTIPKRNDSKSNYAKNGAPWFSYRYRTNNRNNCHIAVLHHSLVRRVIFIFTKGRVYNVAKFTGPERTLAKSIVATLSIKRIPDTQSSRFNSVLVQPQ